jgi:ankyrin repeat protein
MGMLTGLFGKKPEKLFLDAAKNGDLTEIKALIDNNPEVNFNQATTKAFSKTALHLAVENNHYQVIEFLIKLGADVNAPGRELGMTPLHRAATKGLADAADCLISNGANIDAKNKNGGTPLREAVMWSRLNVAKLLIEKGADVNIKDNDGEIALNMAIRTLSGGPKPSGLRGPDHTLMGDQKYRRDIALLLINKGSDVNAKYKAGTYPLHIAVLKGQLEIAKLLLSKGAEINKNNDGDEATPLHIAAQHNKIDIVNLLLANGADVHAKAAKGYTPLHVAAEWGHIYVVERLLGAGADSNIKETRGFTPLKLAKKASAPKNVVNLLQKYA